MNKITDLVVLTLVVLLVASFAPRFVLCEPLDLDNERDQRLVVIKTDNAGVISNLLNQLDTSREKQQQHDAGLSSYSLPMKKLIKKRKHDRDDERATMLKQLIKLASEIEEDNRESTVTKRQQELANDDEQANLPSGLGEVPDLLQNEAVLTNQLSVKPELEEQRQEHIPHKVDMAKHNERVISDGFGIISKSLFSTNNHLGHQGVPKQMSSEKF